MHEAGIAVYGDASGNQHQSTGATDYEMIREYFAVHTSMPVQYNVPKSNPSVRERINLTNRQLKSAAGTVSLVVDPRCKELTKDLEQVCFKADTNQIDKDRDRMRTSHLIGRSLGYLLWQSNARLEPKPCCNRGDSRSGMLKDAGCNSFFEVAVQNRKAA